MRNNFHSAARLVVLAHILLITSGSPGIVRSEESSPTQTKDKPMVPVATKVAEFKESFVVGSVDFNADGTQLATNATFDGRDVHIWDWRGTSHVARVLHKDAAAGADNALKYSPDGTLLAVGHIGETQKVGMRIIRVWDTRTGEVIHDITTLKGGSGFVVFAFSPDGKFLVRTEEGGGLPGDYVVVHRIDTWEQAWGLPTLPFIPRTLTLSPDGHLAALAGEVSALGPHGPPIISRPQILIIDLAKQKVIRTIDRAFPDYNEIHTLAWSPDGKSLAAGVIVGGSYAGPNAIEIFDPTTGRQIVGEPADIAYVNGLRYSPDGRYLVGGHMDGAVRIWDVDYKHLLQSIPVDTHFHTVLSVSRDSRYVAIAAGKDISVWELKK